MNANQIINMIIRTVTNHLMNWGINKGVDTLSKNKSGEPLTREQRQASQMNKKRTRQAMRILRRFR